MEISKLSPLPQNSIQIYTAFSILLKMKKEVGLEAMIEYVSNYVAIIDKHNLKAKMAVTEALRLIDVEKMYKDALRCKEKA